MGIRFGISLFFIVFLVVISHVFDKFKDILLLAAQLLRYLTFASSVSDSLLTGTLMVKSIPANSHALGVSLTPAG